MKMTTRMLLGLLVISCGILAIMPDEAFYRYVPISVSLITVGVVSGLLSFGFLIYHWARTKFKNKIWKILWFLILLVFYPFMIGPAIYYLVVFELRKTVVVK